ncbi:MAG TPA: TonB-dependent receptor [Caulobacteraceae bacterium]|nr:TonB-dependent receptor [Caulobacteraceae bacterium]
MRLNKAFLLCTTVVAGLALAPVAAFAQSSTAQTTDQAPATKAPESSGSVSELVVTGSHIHTNEFSSSSPIQVITSDTSELQGVTNTAEIVQKSSVASGSFQANNLLSGYVVTGGENAETLSLRGLGANRTLVLLNGRRLSPAGIGGTVGPVDLNILPSSIIDRVDILKDGASSIYGSDAVAGVANFITKRNTDGIEINLHYDQPFHQGGGQDRFSITWGKVWDRGSLMLTADWNEDMRQKAIDRSYTSCAEDFVSDPTTHQRVDFIDPATGSYKCYNAIHGGWQAYSTYGGVFIYDPALNRGPPGGYPAAALSTRPFLPDWVRCCRAGQPATYPYGPYNDPIIQNSDVISPVKRATFFLSGSYDITPQVEAYTEVLLNQRRSSGTYYQYLFEWVDPTNPTNTVAPGLIAGGVNPALAYARPLVIFPYNEQERINYGRILGGLRGKIGGSSFLSGWDWDIYAQYGRSDARYTQDFIYQDRVFATTGPGVACDPSQITVSGPVSCMAIPWFSEHFLAGNLTPQEMAFLRGRETGTTKYDQWLVEASLTGTLMQLPAGPLGVAVGAVYRHDHINDTPGYNARNSNYWGFSTSGITQGSDAVKEFYGELQIPILKNMPGFESLDGTLSGRYTDYDSYGSNFTYKVGLDWRLTNWLRLRGSHGTSYRAPALFELYLADQSSFFNGNDPCAMWGESSDPRIQQHCAAAGIPNNYPGPGATPQVFSGGGKGRLTAETSRATTVGLVLTPSFFNVSIALDYFDIEVRNEVSKFGPTNILNACYDTTTYPNDFCTLFTRDPATHDITTIFDNYINIANEHNRGLDLTTQVKYDTRWGKLTLDTQFTWQFEDVVNLLGSNPVDNNGSTTEPDFTGVANLRFDHNDWTFFWSTEFIGKASDTELLGQDVYNSTRYNQPVYYKQYTELTIYHSVSVRKKWDNWSAQVGIQNLFDEPPPAQSAGQFRAGIAALNEFDLRGRRVFITLDRKF